MNTGKLEQAEAEFLSRYPGGFLNPEMEAIGKKHKVNKLTDFAQENLKKKNFRDAAQVMETVTKIISRSSMISLFEKPKFRDFAKGLAARDRNNFVKGLQEQLYGDQQNGFERVLHLMQAEKLGKWSLISICPFYFKPEQEIFVKPTTTKGVIAHFEIDELKYNPTPSWDFYARYRDILTQMKAKVNPDLAPNNAAFTGFLMMSLKN